MDVPTAFAEAALDRTVRRNIAAKTAPKMFFRKVYPIIIEKTSIKIYRDSGGKRAHEAGHTGTDVKTFARGLWVWGSSRIVVVSGFGFGG